MTGLCTERCKGCYFYGQRTETCDYLLVTGERRGCPPGPRCTRFQAGDYIVKRRALLMTPRQAMRHHRMKELYDKGLTDREIADLVHVAKQTVFMWRKKNNLPAHARFGGDRKI